MFIIKKIWDLALWSQKTITYRKKLKLSGINEGWIGRKPSTFEHYHQGNWWNGYLIMEKILPPGQGTRKQIKCTYFPLR